MRLLIYPQTLPTAQKINSLESAMCPFIFITRATNQGGYLNAKRYKRNTRKVLKKIQNKLGNGG
jgi:hypothetical protein